MSLVCVFPGSRLEPAEYVSTEPVTCVRCGWEGDAEENVGEYHILSGPLPGHPHSDEGDVICSDCSVFCEDCGEDLMDKGDYLGALVDRVPLCWFCVSEALIAEAL